jgi:hypothetical protein
VALGIYGSTFVDELNRLANGGTYPALQLYVDESGAAADWAALRGVDIGPLSDSTGILNVIYDANAPKSQWLDIAGICNKLAGTTGLEPAAALRQVAS